jgi:hypothetical protein
VTEAEWLACTDPEKMLESLLGKASDRKLRLFAVACCWLSWGFIADDRNRRAVELAECLADGAAAGRDLRRVRASTRDGTAWCTIMGSASEAALHAARSGAGDAARSAARDKAWAGREARDSAWRLTRAAARLTQAGVLRCIFGNPFRPSPPPPPTVLVWGDATVPKLAQGIYDERAFDRLPILADALEEAGCTNADILGHLRGPGPHYRGCWAVDLLLGKG